MINLKKVILVLIVLLLTGCFDNGAYLTNICVKEDKANSLTSTITYTIGFEQDIIDKVDITLDYQDSLSNTISAIKLSLETQHNFWQDKVDYNILIDNENHYKVEYNLDLNEKEILNHFKIEDKRSQLVKKLEKEGFICE